ncbi:MAG: exodeoxyribonuclease VII small subunit [Ruminococcaceae bacterium]|nr:exodeoxyribonuclease VII small subunit [Oscillospiraceae bacterium]
MANEQLKFEQAMTDLASVVAKLEAGNVPLDEALQYYEEGMRLIRFCTACLDEAEQRIEAVRKTESGFVTEPFGD